MKSKIIHTSTSIHRVPKRNTDTHTQIQIQIRIDKEQQWIGGASAAAAAVICVCFYFAQKFKRLKFYFLNLAWNRTE